MPGNLQHGGQNPPDAPPYDAERIIAMFSDTPLISTMSARNDEILNRARDILDARFEHWDIVRHESYCYVSAPGVDSPSPGLTGLGWNLHFQIMDMARQICKRG